MARPQLSIPSYRHHKASDLGFVVIDGRSHYLGRYNSPESREAYARVLASWNANGSLPKPRRAAPLTIVGMLAAFWEHVEREGLYLKNGRRTSERLCLAIALRPLATLFGNTLAAEFGPRDLITARKELCSPRPAMPGEKRRRVHTLPIVRSSVNKHLHRIRRVFRWAVAMELIPESTWNALRAVDGIRKGQSMAVRESSKVKPANLRDVVTVLRKASPLTAALIRLQWYTGARPGEAIQLRLGDIDRKGAVWLYRPGSHKNEHRDIEREIPLGPKAQRVLAPFLSLDPSAYLFPGRFANAHVGEAAYAKSIARICDAEGCGHWTPHQLRHNAATRIRRTHGLDAARTVLGHSDAETTTIYAERDSRTAREVALATG